MIRNRLIAPLVLAALATGCGSAPPPKHLVLITVDTLRADRLGAYGYEDARTPAIDALAAESIRFERAYAHASLTEPSIASLITGRLPAETGVYHNQSELEPGITTLAEMLKAEGFETGAFLGSYVLRPGHGLERGFDRYTETFIGKEKIRPIPENPGGVLTDDAVSWAASRAPDRRIFLWVHYQEPHGPYTPAGFQARPAPPGERELPMSFSQSGRDAIPRYQWLGHGRLSEYSQRYDGEIAETDWFVGMLVRGLRDKGIWDDSLVVFTADHGESFGEDSLYCAHGEGLDESLLRVPLLLHWPGSRAGVRRDVVRLIDVLPTALELLGVPAKGELPGASLLADVGDRRVVSQAVNVRLGPARWRGLRDEGVEIVERDAGETVVRSLDRDGAVPAELRERLERELARIQPWPRDRHEALSKQEREALRALGYAE